MSKAATTGTVDRGLFTGVTLRAIIAGQLLAVVLCFVNSYITLKVGIMDEGYIVSMLIFNIFVAIFASKKARKGALLTSTEAIVVGTMGSAGGSTGFIANFFGAIYMVSLETGAAPFTFWEMAIFTFVSSCVGVVLAVPMVRLFVIGNPLVWPIGQAARKTVKVISSMAESIQPRVLSFFAALFGLYMFLSMGVGWFPEASIIVAGGLAISGLGVAWSPFVFGAGYLIKVRMGWGFLVGGVVMFVMGAYLPVEYAIEGGKGVMKQIAPHRFMWPGVMALTTAGLTALALSMPTIIKSMRTIKSAAGKTGAKDQILGGKWLMIALIVVYLLAGLMLNGMFRVSVQQIVLAVLIGTIVLNIIATLAFGNTGFNPVRVMGILLMVVFVAFGESDVTILLVAAGLAATIIGQTSIMTQDIFVGREYKIAPKAMMALQISTFIPVSLAAAWSFQMISSTFHFPVEGADPGDPLLLHGVVMKTWHVMAVLFSKDGVSSLPGYAITSMWIGGAAGIVLALIDHYAGTRMKATAVANQQSIEQSKEMARASLRASGKEISDDTDVEFEMPELRTTPWRLMPHVMGITIAMILPIFYSVTFFLGALVLCYLLPKWLKTDDDSLNSIAVAGIVGEGIGAPVVAILKSLFFGGGGH